MFLNTLKFAAGAALALGLAAGGVGLTAGRAGAGDGEPPAGVPASPHSVHAPTEPGASSQSDAVRMDVLAKRMERIERSLQEVIKVLDPRRPVGQQRETAAEPAPKGNADQPNPKANADQPKPKVNQAGARANMPDSEANQSTAPASQPAGPDQLVATNAERPVPVPRGDAGQSTATIGGTAGARSGPGDVPVPAYSQPGSQPPRPAQLNARENAKPGIGPDIRAGQSAAPDAGSAGARSGPVDPSFPAVPSPASRRSQLEDLERRMDGIDASLREILLRLGAPRSDSSLQAR